MSAQDIWNYLIDRISNPYGVAAIMGNLMAESSMSPVCATGRYPQSSASEYVNDIKTGKTTKDEFAHDGVAFGLAQWRYWSRKEAMLVYVGTDNIDNPYSQLAYLIYEMEAYYKKVWTAVVNATDIRAASDMVMLKYEKPGDTSDHAKKKRYEYAMQFYNQFARAAKPKTIKKVVQATSSVNIRAGHGLSTRKIGSVPAGTELEWIATEDGWHKVAVWVSGDFSTVKEK